MDRFTTAVEQCLVTSNWTGALAISLMLPDICMGLENPRMSHGDRYREWFKRYMQQHYETHVVERDESKNPGGSIRDRKTEADQISFAKAKIAYIETRREVTKNVLSGDDFYGLRCGLIHDGTGINSPKKTEFYRSSCSHILSRTITCT